MPSFEEMVRELLRQKRKYHAKLLTDSAMLITFDLSFETLDIFEVMVWINTDLFTNISISLGMTFSIDLAEFEQLWQTFKVELPSLGELMQGILINFKRFKLPEIGTISDFIDLNIKDEYKEEMKESMVKKGVYGVTRYGRSYYDPVNVRKFIANVIPKFFHRLATYESFRRFTEGYRDSLGVLDIIARYIFNKLSIMDSALKKNFVLGYGILGYSNLTPRASEEAQLDFVDFEGRTVSMRYMFLDNLQYGFILGITPLGFGFLTPRETTYKEPSPRCVWWVQDIAWNTITRYPLTPWGVANYNKPEERLDFRVSDRTHQYAAMQAIRYKIEEMVENLLAEEKLSVTELRQYKNAALQLLSLRTKRHEWGFSPFKEMSDEELKRWWLEYWKRQGLKPSTLQKILEVMGRWLREWEKQKLRLGKLVQLRRRMLARLL